MIHSSPEAKTEQGLSQDALDDLVASTDTGGRNPSGLAQKLIIGAALLWSIFQLYFASPFPFLFNEWFGNGFTLNDTEARSIHLSFALFLGFMAYPALKNSPRSYIPWQDYLFALGGIASAGYIFFFYVELSDRPGAPIPQDIWISVIGILLLLEATRRTLGPPLMIVAMVFLAYVFFGDSPLLPEVLQWKGASINKTMSHMWLGTEGVFGIALGVSTKFVFLFVLFGSLLDKAGAGNYFIKVAFALLGHLRGGPAKAAVVSSAMTGLISGSSIANVVTTGTFTIPLMKRVGFSGAKAGSVEVASSVNGQIMPPVMGAAAFLMVEYVGISYVEVVKHAFLPAIISYIALLYIVHLEALKNNMQGLPKPGTPRALPYVLIGFLIKTASILILAGAVYYGIGWMKDIFGEYSALIISILVLGLYIFLTSFESKYPELEEDDPNAPVVKLPEAGPTIKVGLHFILPIVVLVWFLMVERKSPGASAFWATSLLILILITQRPLMAFFRKNMPIMTAWRQGWVDLYEGLIAGARNMIGIGIATATAGIIVGTISLTGVGQVMAAFVEILSMGQVELMLIWVAILSLILGMGLPTTANYIVVSSLMAPVIVQLGAESGLIVPLIAVHLFVFYFGIMADVTPPVGLASFAAAAVSGADPIKTGFTAFFYSLRTVVLPFIFIFNPKLILIGIEGPVDLTITVISAVLGVLIFAAATQGYFRQKSRWYETILLLLVAFMLFRPGFVWDKIYPPFDTRPGTEIIAVADNLETGAPLTMRVSGSDLDGNDVNKVIRLPMGVGNSGKERLEDSGIILRFEDNKAIIDQVGFASQAEKMGLDFDFEISSIKVASDRLPKELMFIPALLLLILVWHIQGRREEKTVPVTS